MSIRDQFQPGLMKECLIMAAANVGSGRGGPFAALVVKDGLIIGRGINRVLETQDPTAHAEMEAIRNACQHLGNYQLEGCFIYCSCEPCPMCLGAIYWARPAAVFYAASREDAAKAGFDDSLIYTEVNLAGEKRKIKALRFMAEEGRIPFKEWMENPRNDLY